MKKAVFVFAGLVVLGLVGIVAAQGMWGKAAGTTNGTFHDRMYEIMESGSYQDLVELREDAGFQMKPWVQSEEDFEIAKERHARMKTDGGGFTNGCSLRASGGCGMRATGICPMMG